MLRNEKEQAWRTLIAKIREGHCTPVLGAGTAHPTLPLARDLAEALLQKEESGSGIRAPLPDRHDLAKVTQYIAVQRRDNPIAKMELANYLKERTEAQKKTPAKPGMGQRSKSKRTDPLAADEPHRALAALRLPIYLTTNYDDFMLKALQEVGLSPVRETARWNPELLEEVESAFDRGYEPSRQEPLVFHIHGHWDLHKSIVATEDDYLDFMVNISRDLATGPIDSSKRTMLPPRVRRALKDTTLLFVGYSLADINFRVILRGLVGSLAPSMRHMSVSVQYCEGEPGKLESYIERYFDHTLKLNVFWYSPQEFCRELNQRLAVAARTASAG